MWVSELFAMRGIAPGGKRWTTSYYDRFLPPWAGFAGSTTVAADGDGLILASGFANSVQVMDPRHGGRLVRHADAGRRHQRHPP